MCSTADRVVSGTMYLKKSRIKTSAKALVILVSVTLVMFLVAHSGTMVEAAQPKQTLQVLDQGFGFSPVLLVGSQDRMYALWVHSFNRDASTGLGDIAIMYSRQTSAGIWSRPVDVLVSPADTTGIDAVIDHQNTIHLIIETNSKLYYSRAQADIAERPRNWSPLKVLAPFAATSSIALGPDGRTIHVVFPEIRSQVNRVYHILSTDGGATWSERDALPSPVDSGADPVNAHLVIAKSGRLHVAWTESIEDFPPSGVFYAFSNDQGKTWSAPRRIAGGGYSWPTLGLESDDKRVHLVWSGTGTVAGKYHSMSSDGGITWSKPTMIFNGWAGFLGRSEFVLDSAGVLHMGIPMGGLLDGKNVYRGQLFETIWENGRWTDPEPIASALWANPLLEQGHPSMVITGGNLLHIAWSGLYWPDKKVSTVWYTTQQLDSPSAPVRDWPTVAPSHTPTLLHVPTETSSFQSDLRQSTPVVDERASNSDQGKIKVVNVNSSPMSSLAVAIVPPFLLIFVVVLWRIYGHGVGR